MITKIELDKLVEKYETTDFIKSDPVQFPHRGKTKEEIELYGFIASLFAYGNRKIFIKKLNEIFNYAEGDICGFIKNGDFKSLLGVEYRFSKDYDIIAIFKILSTLYNSSNGLSELFEFGYSKTKTLSDGVALQVVTDYFYSNAPKSAKQGFYHMVPNPKKGGAMKRMNMFLRWMVRKGPVDFGCWDFISASDLLIPLDVHVAKISREVGLLSCKSNNFKAVLELTSNLKTFSPQDPIKYDFAMFAYDIELASKP